MACPGNPDRDLDGDSNHAERHPIAVIGGGIGGLVLAYRLRKALPEAAVELFEATDDWGGRVAVGNLMGEPLPLGAMRFHTSRHPRTRALLHELKAEAVEWPYRLSHSVLSRRGLLLDAEQAVALLGKPELPPLLARDLSGYGFAFSGPFAFRREKILTLPEFAPTGWLVPSSGFREIVERIRSRIASSIPLHSGARLIGMDRPADDTGVRLTFRLSDRVVQRRARQVALCIGPSTLREVSGNLAGKLSRVAQAIETVPKLRAWLRTDTPLHRSFLIPDHAVVTCDGLCRKVYLNGRNAMIYCDSEHAEELNRILVAAGSRAAQVLMNRLFCELALGEHRPGVVGAIWRYWGAGIHFSHLSREESCAICDLGSVSVVDEAFSDEPGFIEGVLQESERTAELVVGRYRIC